MATLKVQPSILIKHLFGSAGQVTVRRTRRGHTAHARVYNTPPPTTPPLVEYTLVLRQGLDGYAGTADAGGGLLYKDRNYGASTTFSIAHAALGVTAFWLRFEAPALPGLISIVSATLQLYHGSNPTPPVDEFEIRLACINKLWNEGNKTGQDAAPGEVTFNSARHAQLAWTTPPGFHVPLDRDDHTAAIPFPQAAGYFNYDVAAYASNRMYGADPNYGVILWAHRLAGTSYATAGTITRNNATETARPTLTLKYMAPA